MTVLIMTIFQGLAGTRLCNKRETKGGPSIPSRGFSPLKDISHTLNKIPLVMDYQKISGLTDVKGPSRAHVWQVPNDSGAAPTVAARRHGPSQSAEPIGLVYIVSRYEITVSVSEYYRSKTFRG